MTNDFDAESLDALLRVLGEAGALKSLRRAGWVRVGLREVESVADHSYRLALLALLIGPRLGLDTDAMVRLALLHDLGEARLGDLTPADRVPPAEKHRRESAAVAAIVAALPEAGALHRQWQAYADGATPEARVVQQLDKLEMALQALAYERAHGVDLQEFWDSARAALQEPLLIALYDRLAAQRPLPPRTV
jgi:putative hydrolase of HD superfamily